MSVSVNWNQPTILVVKDLITVTNPDFATYYDKYDLGIPNTTSDNGSNTVITLSPKPGSGQNGTVDLFYTRPECNTYIEARPSSHSTTWPTDIPKYTENSPLTDVLIGINAMLEIQLVETDISADSLNNYWTVSEDGTYGTVTLVMSQNNLLFEPYDKLTLNVQFQS
jgi:hypothetical protein